MHAIFLVSVDGLKPARETHKTKAATVCSRGRSSAVSQRRGKRRKDLKTAHDTTASQFLERITKFVFQIVEIATEITSRFALMNYLQHPQMCAYPLFHPHFLRDVYEKPAPELHHRIRGTRVWDSTLRNRVPWPCQEAKSSLNRGLRKRRLNPFPYPSLRSIRSKPNLIFEAHTSRGTSPTSRLVCDGLLQVIIVTVERKPRLPSVSHLRVNMPA